MHPSDAYTLLPNMRDHRCFGCSPANPSGLHMKFYGSDDSVLSWLKVPEHLCGWNTLVHGGIISTILDEIMSRAAVYLLGRIILTKSMTVNFVRPVFIQREVKAEGKILEKVSDREARISGKLYDETGALCARSTGTFALFTPASASKLGFIDADLINALEKLMLKAEDPS
jgi:uncharacterized protein (TIGR00369 family)